MGGGDRSPHETSKLGQLAHKYRSAGGGLTGLAARCPVSDAPHRSLCQQRQISTGGELTGNALTAPEPAQTMFSDGSPDLNQCIAMAAG
ncbi:MAG: hypothetical protein AAF283_04115 [Cyanobacteria bacterium P01_A01_bin.70]